MIMAVLSSFSNSENKKLKISGIILSGGITPEIPIMNLLIKAGIPVLLAKSDTYDVATSIHGMTVKIRVRDKEKISAVIQLVEQHVDLDRIYKEI